MVRYHPQLVDTGPGDEDARIVFRLGGKEATNAVLVVRTLCLPTVWLPQFAGADLESVFVSRSCSPTSHAHPVAGHGATVLPRRSRAEFARGGPTCSSVHAWHDLLPCSGNLSFQSRNAYHAARRLERFQAAGARFSAPEPGSCLWCSANERRSAAGAEQRFVCSSQRTASTSAGRQRKLAICSNIAAISDNPHCCAPRACLSGRVCCLRAGENANSNDPSLAIFQLATTNIEYRSTYRPSNTSGSAAVGEHAATSPDARDYPGGTPVQQSEIDCRGSRAHA